MVRIHPWALESSVNPGIHGCARVENKDCSRLIKLKNMRRFIYDLYYADEISEDLCIKLIEKLNEVSEKRRKKRGGY